MSDNDVKIKLSLDGADAVSKGLAGVGDSAAQSDGKIKGLVSGGLAGAGKALVGFTVASAAAGAALSGAVVSAYADAQQSVGGIETLFGKSADSMKQYAADAYKTAGLSANEFMEQATGFAASLTGSLGEGADAAKAANDIMVAMSDNANKMGTDIGAIQNAYSGFAKQNYTMLDNLKLGYGGTQQEMQRLLDDAGKLSGIKYDISSFADVSAAIQVIQTEMGIAGTTAEEAASTVSGSIGMLKGSFDNLLVSLGAAGDESLSFLDLQEQAANVVSSFQTVVTNVAPVIESIGSSLATLGPQLGTMLQGLVGTVAAVIPDLITAGTGMIGGLIQGIIGAAPGLISAIVPAVSQIVQMFASQGPALIQAGMQAIVALGNGLIQALPTLLPVIVTMIQGMADNFIANLPMLIEMAIQLVTSLADSLIANLPLLLDVAVQLITALGQGLITALPQLIALLPELITGLIDGLLAAIPQLIQAGVDLLVSLIGALPQIISTIVNALPQIITGVVNGILKALPQLIKAGIDLFTSLIKALPQIITTIVKALPKIIVAVVEALIGAIPQLIEGGIQLFLGLVQAVGEVLPELLDAIINMGGDLIDSLMEIDLLQVGKDMIQGLVNGLQAAGQFVLDKLMEIAKGAIDGFKKFFGIKSPSRLFYSMGIFMMHGLGNGLTGGSAYAKKSLATSMKDMKSLMREYEKGYAKEYLDARIKLRGLLDQETKDMTKAEKARRKLEIKEARQEIADLKKISKERLAIVTAASKAQLAEAKAALQELKKARADFISSMQDSVTKSVDVSKLNYSGEIIGSLKDQIAAVDAFRVKLKKLQDMGLDNTSRDQLLQEFLSSGDSTAVDALLAGGPAAVKEIASLRDKLSESGKKLGTVVANDMYNAGIQVAEGLVKGLAANDKKVEAAAKALAEKIAKATKKALKIKSPSKLFEDEIGAMLPPGLGRGVAKTTDKAISPIRSLNAQIVLEAKKLTPLTLAATTATASPSVSPLVGVMPTVVPRFDMWGAFQAMEARLTAQQATLVAKIDPEDMTKMAKQVGSAMVDIRNADNYTMTSAIQRGDF